MATNSLLQVIPGGPEPAPTNTLPQFESLPPEKPATQLDATASGIMDQPQMTPYAERFMPKEPDYGPISAGGVTSSGQGPGGTQGAQG